MTTSMTWRGRIVLAALANALLLAGTATAGAGPPAAVNTVEGQSFSGAVATYTSTVTPNERFVAQAYIDLLGRPAGTAELNTFTTFLANGGTGTQAAKALLASNEYRTALISS